MKWKCPGCGREFSRQGQDHDCLRPQTIDEYIAAQEEEIRPVLVRTLLQSTLPEAE